MKGDALSFTRLVNHAVITGMSGSGKTGLITVLVEEALREQVTVNSIASAHARQN